MRGSRLLSKGVKGVRGESLVGVGEDGCLTRKAFSQVCSRMVERCLDALLVVLPAYSFA